MEGVVRTPAGLVRGVDEGGVWVFRGLPYGHIPERTGRFRAPSAPVPWADVREAFSWGPIAPQTPPVPGFSLPGDPTRSEEDCLNLNVWTPGADDERRPVMVWLHGGGFTTGNGSSALFEGRHLAARGVVVVTVNYRLGALGFLGHPALVDAADGDGGGWGNWGLHDQLAALRWVRDSIAEFGGDPGNVTLFGESAGAMSISALLSAPAGRGLFHRAVLQSGPPATGSAAWAMDRAERLARHLGLSRLDRGSMEAVAPGRWVDATRRLAAELPDDGGLPLPLLPVVDGGLLDRVPGDALADGRWPPVPLLVGTTRDECALFTLADLTDPPDEARIVGRMGRLFGRDAAEIVFETYREARTGRGEPVTGRDLWTAITTDYVFRVPSLTLAAAHGAATYAYLFTRESPFLGGSFGSCHGLDIPFVFGTVQSAAVQVFTGSDPAATALSEQMQMAWVAFAQTGNPSCDAVGEWAAYDSARLPTYVFGPGGGLQDDPRSTERRVWGDAGIANRAGHHHE